MLFCLLCILNGLVSRLVDRVAILVELNHVVVRESNTVSIDSISTMLVVAVADVHVPLDVRILWCVKLAVIHLELRVAHDRL